MRRVTIKCMLCVTPRYNQKLEHTQNAILQLLSQLISQERFRCFLGKRVQIIRGPPMLKPNKFPD